ncbi:MAG: hypothetical protein ACLUKN_05640 [Bacilli bacterium]
MEGYEYSIFSNFLAIALSAECSAGDFRCGEPILREVRCRLVRGLINNAVGTLDSDGKNFFMLFVGMYDE